MGHIIHFSAIRLRARHQIYKYLVTLTTAIFHENVISFELLNTNGNERDRQTESGRETVKRDRHSLRKRSKKCIYARTVPFKSILNRFTLLTYYKLVTCVSDGLCNGSRSELSLWTSTDMHPRVTHGIFKSTRSIMFVSTQIPYWIVHIYKSDFAQCRRIKINIYIKGTIFVFNHVKYDNIFSPYIPCTHP